MNPASEKPEPQTPKMRMNSADSAMTVALNQKSCI